MDREISAVVKRTGAEPERAPAWVIPLVTSIAAATIEQAAQLLGYRTWHPYSYLPRHIIVANATLLLQSAPYVLPALAGLAAAMVGFIGSGKKDRGLGRKDITCVLGGFSWDRNSFCRGWLVTGATGSGKTKSGVDPVMHQVTMREAGVEKPTWGGSELEAKFHDLVGQYEIATGAIIKRRDEIVHRLEDMTAKREAVYQAAIIERLDNEARADLAEITAKKGIEYLAETIETAKDDRTGVLVELGSEGDEQRRAQLRGKLESLNLRIDELQADRHSQIAAFSIAGLSGPRQQDLKQIDGVIEELTAAVDRIETEEIFPLRERLQKQLRFVEPARYTAFPWGGICVDEKGLYYQTLVGMARHYQREHHLMLLQTRPTWAPEGWQPPARFNLLSDEQIPENTYAKALVDTATSVAGGEGDKGFFKTQAESNIGWSIALQRAVRTLLIQNGTEASELTFPSIKLCLQLLSSKKFFDTWVQENGCYGGEKKNQAGTFDKFDAQIQSPKLTEALEHFKNRYWSQPPDQLGGVQGTIYNYLNYFTADEIADVFCADNTFDIRDIDRGMILCVAMPQKLQVERRYVCTLLKLLFYQHVLRRFDQAGLPAWTHRNLLICWQDEAQRFVTESDGNVDVIREAGATTFMCCQGKPSLYAPLGGKEKAGVIILNLRNRLIFQAADDDCATGSADFIGKSERWKQSRSTSSQGTSYSYQQEDAHKIKPFEFRSLPKFTAIVCHADGYFKRAIICPISTDGKLRLDWLSGFSRLSYRFQSWMGRGWAAVEKPKLPPAKEKVA